MFTNELRKQLIERLMTVDPLKVILFGSHAYGRAGQDSDIDLLVVTQDDYLPQSFTEKNLIYLRVAETLIDLEKKMPIDLIVHTKAMHEKFIDLDSMFSRKVIAEGKVLYEKAH